MRPIHYTLILDSPESRIKELEDLQKKTGKQSFEDTIQILNESHEWASEEFYKIYPTLKKT